MRQPESRPFEESTSLMGWVVELLPKDLKFGNIGLNEKAHNLSFIDLNLLIMPLLTLSNIQ